MSDLKEDIETRHGLDRWKDAVFIVGAVLLAALSIGSVTSKVAGRAPHHTWEVSMQAYQDSDLVQR